jgi:hypothetical protein
MWQGKLKASGSSEKLLQVVQSAANGDGLTLISSPPELIDQTQPTRNAAVREKLYCGSSDACNV